LEAILQIIDEELPTRRVRPVADEQVVQARLAFSRDFFRSLPRDISRQPFQVTVAEREQQAEQIVQHPKLHVPDGDDEQVVQARLDFSLEVFRSLPRDITRQLPVAVPVAERQQQAEQIVQQPNLQVLDGGEYIYLAQ
jgi:hypothetical protein